MNLEDYIANLPTDLQEKARSCKSTQELLMLAREEKLPLPDQSLEAIAGGDDPDPENCGSVIECPKCHSTDLTIDKSEWYLDVYHCHCNNCGNNFDYDTE